MKRGSSCLAPSWWLTIYLFPLLPLSLFYFCEMKYIVKKKQRTEESGNEPEVPVCFVLYLHKIDVFGVPSTNSRSSPPHSSAHASWIPLIWCRSSRRTSSSARQTQHIRARASNYLIILMNKCISDVWMNAEPNRLVLPVLTELNSEIRSFSSLPNVYGRQKQNAILLPRKLTFKPDFCALVASCASPLLWEIRTCTEYDEKFR